MPGLENLVKDEREPVSYFRCVDAYREQEVKEFCFDCKTAATNSCPRCGAPLCDEHTPGDEERCAQCERYWLEVASEPNFLIKRNTSRWAEKLCKASLWASGGAFLVSAISGLLFGLFDVPYALVLTIWALGVAFLALPAAVVFGLAIPGAHAADSLGDRLRYAWTRRAFLAERKAPALPPTKDYSGPKTG